MTCDSVSLPGGSYLVSRVGIVLERLTDILYASITGSPFGTNRTTTQKKNLCLCLQCIPAYIHIPFA
ncbi:MAG: hypothetical protein ACE5HH_06020 [Candidatus Hydrothermarchaeales archaeon]